ncbi:MAG TPA: hypothetical protein VEX18_12775, partial [Polyangiaceae bacterium]|nr:hypothetical protein [Polyangiaceae bacterium]
MTSQLRVRVTGIAAVLMAAFGCGPSGDGETSDGEMTDLPASGSELEHVAFQVPGRDFRTAPPKISSMHLFPGQPARSDGKVLLEATID